MFRVVIHQPASSSIHLDLDEGASASEALRKALQPLGLPIHHGYTEKEILDGWRLRARRNVEEGRWWSEDDISEYSDRKSEAVFLNQAECQLYLVLMTPWTPLKWSTTSYHLINL